MLLADLLNYGAAAQKYTNYKTGELVNADLPVSGSTVAPTDKDNVREVTVSSDTSLKLTAAGVRFDYVNSIYVKLTAASLDGVTVTIGGIEAEIVSLGGNKYVAYSLGITPSAFGTAFTVNLAKDGVVLQTVTYSVNSYAYVMMNDADMGELALTLYRLGVSTKAYNS